MDARAADGERIEHRVWAPEATRMRVVAGDESLEMERAGGGWWRAMALPGDYGFQIGDDDAVRPDPRSRHQPRGVHERSRPFDASAHEWQDAGWHGRPIAGGVIYELHVGTFTPAGTLDAAIERFVHLRSIGVTHVELLPVNAVNGTHNWGYDGVAWFAVHEPYGGPAAYQRFVDAAHRAGLAVVQDVVHNHLGPSGNYLPLFGPYLTEGRSTWGEHMNLAEPEVRRLVLDNVRFWFADMHVDALRLDAVHALVDEGPLHILEEMAIETASLAAHLGRTLELIAESDLNDPRLITPREAGGYGLDAQWSDDLHHGLHVALTGETEGYYADFAPLESLAKALRSGFFHDGTMSTFRGREHGVPIDLERSPAWRLVVSAQNHDQIGNRARGDRITEALTESQLLCAALVLYAGPSTPMLFMGEEWGATTPFQFFTSHPEPELGRATAEGRLAEFERMGWDPTVVPDPQDPATFERSKLRWEEPYPARSQLVEPDAEGARVETTASPLVEPSPQVEERVGAADVRHETGDDLRHETPDSTPHTRILAGYRALAALRRELPALTDPSWLANRVTADEATRVLRLERGIAPDAPLARREEGATEPAPAVEVVLNLGAAAQTVEVAGARLRFQTHPDVALAGASLTLPPGSGALVTRA